MQFSTPELYEAFSKISPYNYDYCSMCFRSSSERRLVKPRAFKKFTMEVFFDYTLAAKNQVCYMCEKQARDAYKFYESVEFASTLNRLLKDYWIMQKKMQNSEMGEKFKFMHLLKSKVPLYKGPVEKWESNLKKIRGRTELMQTEVLVIDSVGAVDPQNNVDLVTEDNAEVFIVPDEPAELLNRKSKDTIIPGTRIDSVIIIDEEEDSSEPVPSGPKLVPIEKLLSKNNDQNIILDNSDPLSIGLSHIPQPVKPSLPQNLQPSLPQPIQPSLPQNLQPSLPQPILPSLPQNVQPPHIVNNVLNSTNIGGYILHPVIINANGNISVPTLPPGFNMVMADDSNPKIINVEASAITDAITAGRGSNLLQQLLDKPNVLPVKEITGPTASDHIKNMELLIQPLASEIRSQADHGSTRVDAADKDKKRNIDNEEDSSVKKMKGECKIPEQRNDRIDWEDKIPMDVISFMDAIDPHPNPLFARRNKSMPYEITEVRSLSEGAGNKATNKSNNVIDLC